MTHTGISVRGYYQGMPCLYSDDEGCPDIDCSHNGRLTMTFKEELNYVATQANVDKDEEARKAQYKRWELAPAVAEAVGPALVTAFKSVALRGDLDYVLDLNDLSEGVRCAMHHVSSLDGFDHRRFMDCLVAKFPSLKIDRVTTDRTFFSWR